MKHYWHVRLMKMEGISLQRRRDNLLEVIVGGLVLKVVCTYIQVNGRDSFSMGGGSKEAF